MESSEVDGYPALISSVMAFTPEIHVFGGFAEDAVLFGRTQRSHQDLDVLVRRHDLDGQLENAGRIGFDAFTVLFEPVAGRPLVLGGSIGDLELEIGVCDVTSDGSIFFPVPDSDGRLREIHLSSGVFDHPTATLDGIPVRTVSPLALYQIRAGLTTLGVFGPPRPKDIVSQAALRDRFFPDVPEETLAPTLI